MDDKKIMWGLIMRFSYSLMVLLVYAAGAVLVELAARGMRWLGVSDISYYLLSGTAHLMLFMDAVLLLLLLFISAKKFLNGVEHEQ
jgi:hypothetical protein